MALAGPRAFRLNPDPSLQPLPYRQGDGAGKGGGTWRGQQEVGRTWNGTVGTVSSPQRVDMHKEKVSRREIGLLTVSKRFPSYQKIMSPPTPPCLEPYYRKPLNFSILDDIGHGIKVSPGLGGCPTGVRGLGWAFSVPNVPSVAPMGAQVGSNPCLMEKRDLSMPCSPLQDSSCWGSVVPAWGGSTRSNTAKGN